MGGIWLAEPVAVRTLLVLSLLFGTACDRALGVPELSGQRCVGPACGTPICGGDPDGVICDVYLDVECPAGARRTVIACRPQCQDEQTCAEVPPIADGRCETSADCQPDHRCLFLEWACHSPPRCGVCDACPDLGPPPPVLCADGSSPGPTWDGEHACITGYACSTCAGPNPAGCTVTGCPPGQFCKPSDADVCAPSGCICTTSGWSCTDDCGGTPAACQ